MIFHAIYTDIERADVDRLVEAQEMGRLVTIGEDGTPHVGLYPFVYDGLTVELHLVRTDEQVVDLRARARCAFEVDEVLATIPSYWVHPENGGVATSYHRTVILECRGHVSDDVEVLAAQQRRLLARYQPEGGFRPLEASDPLYRGSLAMLVAVRLEVVRCRPKFKLGQNRPPEVRAAIVEKLRRRGRPNDVRAADAVAWTLGSPARATPPNGRPRTARDAIDRSQS